MEGRVVDGDGRPVEGAAVSFAPTAALPGTPLLTDSQGRFSVSLNGIFSSLGVTVRKEGFEESNLQLGWPEARPGDTVSARDLRLHAIRRITAGETFEVTVRDDDPYCAPTINDGGLCRTVRLVAPADGLLSVHVAQPFWPFLDGGPASDKPVAAGGEVILELLLSAPAPRTATVVSRLTSRNPVTSGTRRR